jgi:hypothetical protein
MMAKRGGEIKVRGTRVGEMGRYGGLKRIERRGAEALRKKVRRNLI